jgi:YfiH family protein
MPEGAIISFALFRPYQELICAFSTRQGGCSQGIYSGLNLGMNTGDTSENIVKNRESFFRYLAIDEKQVAYGQQRHTACVKMIDRPGIFKETDALVTRQKNIFLAVLTADCFPVFLFDPLSAMVSIIHAGWKGTQSGIIENTLHLLQVKLGLAAGHLLVAIGPGLQSECFEVREDVYCLFPAHYSSPHAEAGKKYLNLQRVIIDKLVAQGVTREQIECSPECTRCAADRFYSYRREGKNSGRMMGIIGIRK